MPRLTHRALLSLAAFALVTVCASAALQVPKIQVAITQGGGEPTVLSVDEGQQVTVALKGIPPLKLVARVQAGDRSIVRLSVLEPAGSEPQELGHVDARVGGDPVDAPTQPAVKIAVRSVN